MIRFVKSKEIDNRKWDACISQSPQQFIFAFSWYLNAACAGWNALVLNDYDAVFPLCSSSKLGIKYLYQPFFTRHFGVFAKIKMSKNLEQDFFAAIPKSFQYWDFCLHTHHSLFPVKAEARQRVYQELELNKTYNQIRKGYSENLTRNIKRGEKNQLAIDQNFKTSMLIKYFRESQGEKLSFTQKQYTSLKKVMDACSENAITYCWSVWDKTKNILAGAYFMEINNRITYLKGFSTEEGKKMGAMHLLFDEFIKSQGDKNKTLDFGGSSVSSVARFYKNFGADDCLYLQVYSNRLPKFIKWLKE